jgi:carbonic anhydrase
MQTTPKCNEGLRWHLFESPFTITAATLDKMRMFVAETTDDEGDIVTYRDNNRPVQPLHGRTIMQYIDPGVVYFLTSASFVHERLQLKPKQLFS